MIRATFQPLGRQTVYDLVDKDGKQVEGGKRRRRRLWILDPPAADLKCNNRYRYRAYGSQFTWYHGDDVCDHAKEDGRGHRGVIFATFLSGSWYCRAVFFGTISGIGDSADCVQT